MTKKSLKKKGDTSVKDDIVPIQIKVPHTLKKQFKLYCTERDMNMTDVLTDMMRKALKNDKQGGK
ncbi:hypothetical protein [Clostridium massiliodielmoense]|uniref:hypothetical protein n=1 Tax=Clostridium massiliodielmoense TaxID=1776385 RepID=UPI000A26F81E|nr:hypothetical protein [Clostridium massiliodielmoense]